MPQFPAEQRKILPYSLSDIESIETIDDFAKRLSEITGVADDYDRFKFDAWATAYGFERRDEANILTIKIYCNNRHAFNASVLFVTIVFHRQAGDQSAEVIRGWDKAKKP